MAPSLQFKQERWKYEAVPHGEAQGDVELAVNGSVVERRPSLERYDHAIVHLSGQMFHILTFIC